MPRVILPPTWPHNRLLKKGRYHSWGTGTYTSSDADAVTVLRAMPFLLPFTAKCTKMAMQVTAAIANGKTLIGIYKDGGDIYPTELLLNAGELDCSALGHKEVVLSTPFYFRANTLYWLAKVNNLALSWRACNYYNLPNFIGWPATISGHGINSYGRNAANGQTYELTDPFPTAGVFENTLSPPSVFVYIE